VGGVGFEHPPKTSGKSNIPTKTGAQSGARGELSTTGDGATADLGAWLDTCPVPLAPDVRAGIMAMVNAAGESTSEDAS